jgi:hypothetical protein
MAKLRRLLRKIFCLANFQQNNIFMRGQGSSQTDFPELGEGPVLDLGAYSPSFSPGIKSAAEKKMFDCEIL